MKQIKNISRSSSRQNNNDEAFVCLEGNRKREKEKYGNYVSEDIFTKNNNGPIFHKSYSKAIEGELCDKCKCFVANGIASHSVFRELSEVSLISQNNMKFLNKIQFKDKFKENEGNVFVCEQCGQSFMKHAMQLPSKLCCDSFKRSKTNTLLDTKNEKSLRTDLNSSMTKETLSSDFFYQTITRNSSFDLSENQLPEKLQQQLIKNKASGLLHFPNASQQKYESIKVRIPKKEIINLETQVANLNRNFKPSSINANLCIEDISSATSESKLEIVKDIVSKLKKDILFIVNFDNGYSKNNCISDKIDTLEKQLRQLFYLRESLMSNSIFMDVLSTKHKELNKLVNGLREDVFQAYLKLSPGEKYNVARQGAQMGCIFTMLGVLEREIRSTFKEMKILISKTSYSKEKKLKSNNKKFTKSLPILKSSDSGSGDFFESNDMSKLVQPSPNVSISSFVTAQTTPNHEISNELMDLNALSSLIKQYFASEREKAEGNFLKNIKQKVFQYKSKGYDVRFLCNHAIIETPQKSTYIVPIENANFESNMNSVEFENLEFLSEIKEHSSLENRDICLSLFDHLSNPIVSNLYNKQLTILKENLHDQGCFPKEFKCSHGGIKVVKKRKRPTLNSICSEKDFWLDKTKSNLLEEAYDDKLVASGRTESEGLKLPFFKKPFTSNYLFHDFRVCSNTSLYSTVQSDSFISLSSDSRDFIDTNTAASSSKCCSTYNSKSDLVHCENPSELMFENHFTDYYQNKTKSKLNLKNEHVMFESSTKMAVV